MTLTVDSKQLNKLEYWSGSTKGPDRYLALMEDFQMRVLGSAKRIATRSGEREAVATNFKRRIRETFTDTMCFVFDGILNSSTMSTSELGVNNVVKDPVSVVLHLVLDHADRSWIYFRLGFGFGFDFGFWSLGDLGHSIVDHSIQISPTPHEKPRAVDHPSR